MSWLETELHDDPATLQAALAMLDEMDDSPSSSEVSDLSADLIPYDGGAQEAENGKKTRTITGSNTRNRQRNELLYLREKVTQMEETLAALKHNQGTSNRENAVVVSKAARLWEDLAGRQHKHRRAAELENAKLRAMLRVQVKTGRDLMRLIRKSSRGLHESSLLTRTRDNGGVRASASVDDLFVRLQDLYSLTDTLFSNVPSGENMTVLRDFTTSEDDPNTTTVNSYSTWTLPFAMERVLEATWQTVVRESTKDPALSVSKDDTADTTVSVFRWDASKAFRWMQGEIHGRMGAKKFEDHAQNEAVIISNWSAQLDPSLPRSLDDMKFVGDCWIRVLPAPRDSELDQGSLTQIQVIRRIHLEVVAGDTTSQTRQAGMFTDFFFSLIKRSVKWRQETIETLLFSSKCA